MAVRLQNSIRDHSHDTDVAAAIHQPIVAFHKHARKLSRRVSIL
jgi:hypothetical protein